MKEVFTKSFWEGVKRTFDEAREGPPPANTTSQTPAEGDRRDSLSSDSGTDHDGQLLRKPK